MTSWMWIEMVREGERESKRDRKRKRTIHLKENVNKVKIYLYHRVVNSQI